MKLKLIYAVSMMVLALCVSALADVDPRDKGVPDTIRVGWLPNEYNPPFPDSIAIPIYITNDKEVQGFSIGFHYDYDQVEITSINLTNSVIPVDARGFVSKKFVPADNKVLFGWADFTSVGFPANSGGLLFTMNMRILPGAAGPVRVNLDSAFVAPAGFFLITADTSVAPSYNGSTVYPQYKDNDVQLPVMEVGGPTLPGVFSLEQNSPNPFNPSTAIDFAIPRSADVKIEVFNVLGQKVKTLVDQSLKAGYKRVDWDGKDDSGNSVASGIYLYRMSSNEFTETKKMVLLK